MTDRSLLKYVVERLGDSPPAQPHTNELVLAAFEGADAVNAALEGSAPPVPNPDATPTEATGAYLTSISVEGFRGIGPAARLDLVPGPGLTLVVGRNGSGKSSFAEALELALTGTSARWAERSKVWEQGWRNLHHPTARIEARFAVEGSARDVEVRRTWDDSAELAAGITKVTGHAATSLADLGWSNGLSSYPPLLSHNELGRVIDEKPSGLYDALAPILGLGDITDAQRVLSDARTRERDLLRGADTEAVAIKQAAAQLDDERAQRVAGAIDGKKWNLADITEAVGNTGTAVDERSVLASLRGLASLPPVAHDEVDALLTQLSAAQAIQEKVSTSSAGRAKATADLLDAAIAFHTSHESNDCPVCGTTNVLNFEWARKSREEVERLRLEAADADAAVRAEKQLRQRVGALLARVPAAIGPTGDAAGVDLTAIRAAYATLTTVPEGMPLSQLAAHLRTNVPPVTNAIADVMRLAKTELEHREDLWRPLGQRVAAWLGTAPRAVSARQRDKDLSAALDWLRDAHDIIRDARFEPIAAEVQNIWATLRRDSNVELKTLKLAGMTTQRRLVLDVTVDGTDSAALSVMSQGELNCLALSLFLPRASMAASPFRFLVIDDPVQAMDPAKVEGLARVLDRVAASRQVVVFTHDDRLPEMARRLDIKATIIEVTRREGSVVEPRIVADPVKRYFDDAMALTHNDLPEAAQRAIPGLCRVGLEAACQRAVTRKLVASAASHADIDARLATPTTLTTWLALWLYDDAGRGGDVMEGLRKRASPGAVDAVRWCNRGSHEATGQPVVAMVREAETLALAIAKL